MSTNSRRGIVFVVLVAAVLTAVGAFWLRNRDRSNSGPADGDKGERARKEAPSSRIPVRIDQDGWYLTENALLNLSDTPYQKEADNWKFIYAKEVTIILTRDTNVYYTIRPNAESEADSILKSIGSPPGPAPTRKIIKLFTAAIPLRKGRGIQTDDRFMIGGGERGGTIGADVISTEAAKNTLIMPPQKADIFDARTNRMHLPSPP